MAHVKKNTTISAGFKKNIDVYLSMADRRVSIAIGKIPPAIESCSGKGCQKILHSPVNGQQVKRPSDHSANRRCLRIRASGRTGLALSKSRKSL